MATSTIESQVSTLSIAGDKDGDLNLNGHSEPRDLDTVIHYYDEATDLANQAKPKEPEDAEKPKPKVSVIQSQDNHARISSDQIYRHYPETPRKAVNLRVTDITGKESEYTLDKNGFQMSKQVTKVICTPEDLSNDEKIKTEYYPEMQKWLKEV
jgi:hypothetical protein